MGTQRESVPGRQGGVGWSISSVDGCCHDRAAFLLRPPAQAEKSTERFKEGKPLSFVDGRLKKWAG